MATISFAIRSHRGDPTGAPEFVPVVDGVELMDLVARFERERDMEPAGEYGGLIPVYFKFGPANVHYFGLHGAFLSDDGKVPLLGCNCGEWTCDPIYARVEVKGDAVIWREFDSSCRIETTTGSARSCSASRITMQPFLR